MAINVSDDLTIVSTAEAVTNWSCTAGSVTLRTMFAQGANSCSFDPNGTGVKAIGYDAAAANVTVVDKHILAWVNIGSVENNTFANGGQRIRIDRKSVV